MAVYPLGVTQLIQHLLEMTSSRQVAYADDFTVAGSIKDIKYCWKHLNSFEYIFRLLSKSIKIPPYTKKSILINSKCWKHQS